MRRFLLPYLTGSKRSEKQTLEKTPLPKSSEETE